MSNIDLFKNKCKNTIKSEKVNIVNNNPVIQMKKKAINAEK